jgi:outer membrane protein assembly factor BamB
VVCFDANTGKEIWAHADETRHKDGESGDGPRATPTFEGGRIYSLGATGKLNCLDAATGKLIWAHDIVADSKAEEPMWGFSASPLVAQGIVTVLAGGPEGKGVLAYQAVTGQPAWSAGNLTGSYSSLHPAKVAGVDQIIAVASEGMAAFDPASGKQLWDYEWKLGKDFNRVTQPVIVGDADVLIGTGFGNGTRRVHVSRESSGLVAQQVWESRAIAPYYNDMVVHKGHAYGFHANLLVCVDLEAGKGVWKERGYGNGQVLLLADQGLLLVLSEKGEVALVEANPAARKELGRFPAINGKTWNHPVVAGRKLFVRNGEEVACFELPADDQAVVGK